MNKNRQHISYTILLFFWITLSIGQVSGYVFEDINKNNVYDATIDIPLKDILVSNGRDIVKTTSQGQFSITVLPSNPVFVIKPKGYISPINRNKIISFFINPSDIKNKKELCFPLLKNKEKEEVKAVFLGDPQVDVIDDVHHVAKLVVEELADTDFDFMIPLGDLSFDNLSIFNSLSKTLGVINKPVFYTIGNHDIDYTQSFHDVNAAYEKHFGPSYYAFEFGNELFLVLNNIYPLKDNKYEGRIDKTQYQFIRNLLELKNDTKKLTVFMHIPLEGMKDKTQFLEEFNQIEFFFIVAGHTHTQYHKYFERNKSPEAHELVTGAVCGAWWQGPHDLQGIPFGLMYDGTEKGYWFANFKNDEVQYSYKVSGKPTNKQMNIWAPEKKEWSKELNKLNEPYIYANVFAADEHTKVSVSFDNGQKWLSMEKFKGISPYLKRLRFLQTEGRFKSLRVSQIPELKEKSNHLWRIAVPKTLEKGTYLITVKAVNERLKLNATNYKVFWSE